MRGDQNGLRDSVREDARSPLSAWRPMMAFSLSISDTIESVINPRKLLVLKICRSGPGQPPRTKEVEGQVTDLARGFPLGLPAAEGMNEEN